MLDRLGAKGVAAERIVPFPNWVDVGAIRPEAAPGGADFRAQLGIATAATVALYSGNMGAKQGLELLAEVARLSPDVVFVFCGNGAARADLEARCAGLANVHFLDLQPAARLGALLALADIHLLPQRADAADLVMPSKLTGMLASGRPVVATAHPDTELAAVVAGRGRVVPPDDPARFAAAVAELAGAPERRAALGAEARRYAERHLDREAVLGRFEAQLREVAGCRS
jgi:colanic acid biosynthesis glycosyl transferase WcaI